MESYNALNDTFMTQNKRLLQTILKDKIGFKGFIMSDWYAINSDNCTHFSNGCDMNQPGFLANFSGEPNATSSDWYNIQKWIDSNCTTEDRVDDAATRIVAAMYRLNQIPDTVNESNSYNNSVKLGTETISDDTRELNRQAGRESIVLLKNKEDFLPLTNNQINSHDFGSIAIIGNNAKLSECNYLGMDVTCGPSDDLEKRFFKGYTALGWGSGVTTFKEQFAPFDAIESYVNELGWTITNSIDLEEEIDSEEAYEEQDISEIIDFDASVCNSSNVTLVFIGANSGEEYIIVENLVGDREDLEPWHHGEKLVDAVLEKCANSNIVLIVLGPATVNITKWIYNDNIKAILFGGMLGSQGGNALVDILFGEYSPSGHLPYVWAPLNSYPNVTKVNLSDSEKPNEFIYREYTYIEQLYIGQKYVEKYNKSYDFPFGFGLSYTTFEFANLNLQMKKKGLIVQFTVTNTGKYNASIVPMIFLGFPLENYPTRVFKGFDKQFIKIGEEVAFNILVEPHDLSYYDVDQEDFVRPTSGDFKVYVGENARDHQLISTISAAY